MKDLIIYYFQILLPIPLLIGIAEIRVDSFFVLLMLYVLLYRPLTDGYKLIRKGILEERELWKTFIPLWRIKYFKELYFE